MELGILSISGSETGRKAALSDDIFAIEPNDHVIWLDVKHYLANRRQGTHKAKTKNEINRTTKKLMKQKGTGGARRGSLKSPLVRGGGRVFGPTPRDYSFKLNQKTKQLARKSALTYKAQENKIVVIEDFSMEAPKTKNYVDILKGLNLHASKNLMLIGAHNENIYKSSRNLEHNDLLVASDVNTYAILNADKVVITESALRSLSDVLAK
jgi:large subunit ribosomal protein L4